jgi:hypothetical protein
MSPRTRLLVLWAGAILGPLATAYGLLCVVFYAWLEASRTWSTDRAARWASGAFAAACLFALVSIIAIVKFVRHYRARAWGGTR